MKRINIVAWHNGGGLSRDIEILFSALQDSAFELHVNGLPLAQAPVRRQRIVHRASNLAYAWRQRRQLLASPYDVNLFLHGVQQIFSGQVLDGLVDAVGLPLAANVGLGTMIGLVGAGVWASAIAGAL